ncbi:RNA polymerase sigma factor SigE [Mumia zhuanghuii]|uniref:RNA polymerase sigma factor SigE n=2 Tax=Mumia TaxID=1546255 RepID=A0ABW1QHL3_9ACTN|nr:MULTISPECIES: RNA polymerase sigma factor SigE [Mumia]KAA1422665.1 RNA polymerase sigma factor SigE [Mumia zhuanghuii]
MGTTGTPAGSQTASGATVGSWEEIVEQHSARVFRLAYRLTGNQHDAEDLTQEVFIRVFRSLDSFKPGSFEGWIHRITTNLFLDRVRRKSKYRFDRFGEGAEERLRAADPSPELAWSDANLDADVEAALAALPDDFRVAVVLCDIEGLSYEEIADVLGVKLGTVRSRIHRGRKLLRASLEHRAPSGTRTRFAGPMEPAVAPR